MTNTSSVLEFKSSTFFTPILILFSNDFAAIEQSLQEKISRAPDFFKNSPLIIDFRELNNLDLEISVVEIAEMLRKIGLFPIGIRGGNEQQNKQAHKLSIPIDSGRESDSGAAQGEAAVLRRKPRGVQPPPQSEPQPDVRDESAESPAAAEVAQANSVHDANDAQDSAGMLMEPVRATIITHPVRSGQRIYAHGDLVVMSQVSAGAEIMAEGNIHVYNTLRGRALAGVQGNTAARIFCLDLQAELISISGDYKTSEHITKQVQKKPVQVYLQDHALIIKEIA